MACLPRFGPRLSAQKSWRGCVCRLLCVSAATERERDGVCVSNGNEDGALHTVEERKQENDRQHMAASAVTR